jgi:hypothetical protein
MTKSQRENWWSHSKQLQADSLLCLVDKDNGAVFFTVAGQVNDCTSTQPEKQSEKLFGKHFGDNKLVRTETQSSKNDLSKSTTELEQNRSLGAPQSRFDNPNRSLVVIQLVDTRSEDVEHITKNFTTRRQKSLVEFPGIFLPSFRPILQALQAMSRESQLPFQEILAPPAGKEIANLSPPAYAMQLGFHFDLSYLTGIGESIHLSAREPFDPQTLKKARVLTKHKRLPHLT